MYHHAKALKVQSLLPDGSLLFFEWFFFIGDLTQIISFSSHCHYLDHDIMWNFFSTFPGEVRVRLRADIQLHSIKWSSHRIHHPQGKIIKSKRFSIFNPQRWCLGINLFLWDFYNPREFEKSRLHHICTDVKHGAQSDVSEPRAVAGVNRVSDFTPKRCGFIGNRGQGQLQLSSFQDQEELPFKLWWVLVRGCIRCPSLKFLNQGFGLSNFAGRISKKESAFGSGPSNHWCEGLCSITGSQAFYCSQSHWAVFSALGRKARGARGARGSLRTLESIVGSPWKSLPWRSWRTKDKLKPLSWCNTFIFNSGRWPSLCAVDVPCTFSTRSGIAVGIIDAFHMKNFPSPACWKKEILSGPLFCPFNGRGSE